MKKGLISFFLWTIILIVSGSAAANIQAELNYGSGYMLEAPDSLAKVRTELSFARISGEWQVATKPWGFQLEYATAAPDFLGKDGFHRWKASFNYYLENVYFFCGPTWTSYTSQDGSSSTLEGIEMGGAAQVDFTDALHLQGRFAFSPVLKGIAITLPNPEMETLFTGNIAEYYIGVQYDFNKMLALTAGLGGWRALNPIDQTQLVTVDFRRLGLQCSF